MDVKKTDPAHSANSWNLDPVSVTLGITLALPCCPEHWRERALVNTRHFVSCTAQANTTCEPPPPLPAPPVLIQLRASTALFL